jgi:hypothetical protein
VLTDRRAYTLLAAGQAGDRYLQARPRCTRLAIVALAAHLSNAVPDRYDPLHGLFLVVRRARHKIR